jgi:periplasmic divalent cation tolerance protein
LIAATVFNVHMPEKSIDIPVTSTGDDAIAIVLTTVGADFDAVAIARILVEEQLAACVNVLPVMTSVYQWKGKAEQDQEQQLVIKTTSSGVARLAARLRALHPYELPEFLVLRASASEQYGKWVGESVGGGTPGGLRGP